MVVNRFGPPKLHHIQYPLLIDVDNCDIFSSFCWESALLEYLSTCKYLNACLLTYVKVASHVLRTTWHYQTQQYLSAERARVSKRAMSHSNSHPATDSDASFSHPLQCTADGRQIAPPVCHFLLEAVPQSAEKRKRQEGNGFGPNPMNEWYTGAKSSSTLLPITR